MMPSPTIGGKPIPRADKARSETTATRRVEVGAFSPLGATVTPTGVNFALFSRNATAVTLLFYDRAEDGQPNAVIPVINRTRFVWHVFVEGARPGQLYGYKVDGPYDPRAGHRFNPHKLLLDPYARAVAGKVDWRLGRHLAYDAASPDQDLSFDASANDAGAPKGVVVDDAFDWEGDAPPTLAPTDLIIYEAHVKGLTAHPSSPAANKGSFAGVADVIPHLRELGVNALELLPVHECYVDDFLASRGLTNYWGYNTLAYFAPDARFASGAVHGSQVREFKEMVKTLHRAGIEVILDVVYNHTGEGNHLGPTLSFRGVDNATYYQLNPQDRRYYMDYSGCGNSLNVDEPQVVKLIMDSLRHWVEVMHVDGFRFDLASVLGREEGRFDRVNLLFAAMYQDPIISRAKLIAEPWDTAWGSYQVGNFPVDWAEWNGKYRDAVRRFVKGDAGLIGEMASRLTGSSDLYGDDGRTPYHSVNFVTCHDGFTLNDLVSYARKHNDSNGEDNRDGADDNNSWHWGVEGETTDEAILATRAAVAKAYVATLFLSEGTPMLLGGDEFLRTQGGNNNAYCQDNDVSWFDWRLLDKNRAFADFCRAMIAFRQRYAAFRRRSFFSGRDRTRDQIPDITWFGADGRPPNWQDAGERFLAYMIQGSEGEGDAGEADLFLAYNMSWEKRRVTLPRRDGVGPWARALDTSLPPGRDVAPEGLEPTITPADLYVVNGRSVVVLVSRKVSESGSP